jgi:tetratricopeptide (TPR) repeat protein
VASALHYAHGQGTLHRDIKPGNLLLDGQGFVWVTDFGLAKTLEDESISRTGDVVGTLRYMAPEQFSGEADSRSDIYSLGLTLYELLTLRPAYQDSDSNRLLRAISQGEPQQPRKLRPDIPRDLETMVLKSIAREPDHRYQSAGDLAADLQRFLDDLPILARRTSAAERLWRWSKRNRVLASTGGTALALLILLPVVTTVGYLQTSRQREKAEANSELALGALDKIFEQFAPNRIAPLSTLTLPESGTENSEDLEVPIQPVLSKQAASLLEQLLGFYHRLAEQGGDDAKLRLKVAEANRRVGDIRQRLGNLEEARAAYLRALEAYGALEGQSPGSAELRVQAARIQNDLGSVSRSMQESGRPFHEKALSLLQSVAATPVSATFRYELARTHYFLGKRSDRGPGPGPGGPPAGFVMKSGTESGPGQRPQIFEGRKRNRKAEQENLEKAIVLLEGLTAENPRVPDYRHLLALCYREMPPPRDPAGQPAASRTPDKATAILQKLVEDFPEVPDYRYDLSETYAKVDPGNLYFHSGPSATAFPQRDFDSLQKALEISESLVADHPNVPNYAASQAGIRMDLARILRNLGRLDEAEALLRKGKALQHLLVERYPEVTSYKVGKAMVDSSLAKVLRQRKELPEARSLLEDSVSLLEALLKDDQESRKLWPARGVLASNLRTLAGVLREQGEEDRSAQVSRRADDLFLRSGRAPRQLPGQGEAAQE